MSLTCLNADEIDIVRRTLEGAFRYFDEDFRPRLGVSKEEMRFLLERWPEVDDSDDDGCACLAINNALNDLLNGVGIGDEEAIELTGANTDEMRRIYRKWAFARGWSSTGLL